MNRVNNENNPINTEQNRKYSKEDAYKTLDMINMWIGNADTKISYSLTFIGVLLGFFLTSSKPIKLSETISRIYSNGLQILKLNEIIILLLICAFTATSITAIVFLYRALKGIIDPEVYKEDGLITNSNIFWKTISKKSYVDFYNSINILNQEKLIKEISSQVFINSKICTKKFENYNQGVKYIVISVIIFFAYKIIGYIMI